jgi:hypothetical protein
MRNVKDMSSQNRVICIRIERPVPPQEKYHWGGQEDDSEWLHNLLASDNAVSRLWHSAIRHAKEQAQKVKERFKKHESEEHAQHMPEQPQNHQEQVVEVHRPPSPVHNNTEHADSEEALRIRYYEDVHVFREIFEKAAIAWMKFMEEKELLDEAKAEEQEGQAEHEEGADQVLPDEDNASGLPVSKVVYLVKCDMT